MSGQPLHAYSVYFMRKRIKLAAATIALVVAALCFITAFGSIMDAAGRPSRPQNQASERYQRNTLITAAVSGVAGILLAVPATYWLMDSFIKRPNGQR